MALSDRIAVYRTSRLIELISGVPGLEHLERPDYLAEVERLNAGRRQLATAPRQILSNVSSAARIIAAYMSFSTGRSPNAFGMIFVRRRSSRPLRPRTARRRATCR